MRTLSEQANPFLTSPLHPMLSHESSMFEAQRTQALAQENLLKGKLRQTAFLRVAVFGAGIAAVVYFANQQQIAAVWLSLLAMLVPFVALIVRFNRLAYAQRYHAQLAEVNREELALAQRAFADVQERGEAFADEAHPYASDLDIFGKSSVFAFCNRAGTWAGKERLATWLKAPAPLETVRKRQEAAAELLPMLSFRQNFQVKGRLASGTAQNDLALLQQWLNAPLAPMLSAFLLPAMLVGTLLFLGTLALYLAETVSLLWPIGMLGVNFVYLGFRYADLQKALQHVERGAEGLNALSAMLKALEDLSPQSAHLQAVRAKLVGAKGRASDAVRALSRILQHLEARQNVVFFLLVNNPFLYENLPLWQLKRWKAAHAHDLAAWLDALAELEALCSLAAVGYANPAYTFPILSEQPYVLSGRQLGHPLLAPAQCVANDFSLEGQGKIALITGSNMAGKTTFQRTLGVNAVMALAGAPVCAQQLTISYLEVFTSMRIRDALEENVSSFYAELKRFRNLLDLLAEGKPVFFLLDELLRGTNSEDRHDGIRAIMKQLIESTGFGLISTHDLSLAEMAAEFPTHIANFSFNSQIDKGVLHFTYRLEHGKCHSFSASKLMEMMGIKL